MSDYESYDTPLTEEVAPVEDAAPAAYESATYESETPVFGDTASEGLLSELPESSYTPESTTLPNPAAEPEEGPASNPEPPQGEPEPSADPEPEFEPEPSPTDYDGVYNQLNTPVEPEEPADAERHEAYSPDGFYAGY